MKDSDEIEYEINEFVDMPPKEIITKKLKMSTKNIRLNTPEKPVTRSEEQIKFLLSQIEISKEIMNKPKFQCSICDYEALWRDRLVEHMVEDHDYGWQQANDVNFEKR